MNSEIRQCQNCKQDFTIEPDDFGFYEKIKVPPPTFCPLCRAQRVIKKWIPPIDQKKKVARKRLFAQNIIIKKFTNSHQSDMWETPYLLFKAVFFILE